MSFAWQDVLIVIAVVAAAAYICGRAWQAVTGRASSGCGAACPKCNTTTAPKLLSLEQQPARGAEVEVQS